MQVREVTNKDIWEDFLLNIQEKTFLDSWNWGEFQKKQGEKIWRLGIYDDQELIGIALVIKIKAKRGTFLFVPHGPIGEKESGSLLVRLKEIAKQEKAGFIRIASIWERNKENIKIFKDLGFKNAPTHMHPELTWELDITLSEEDLLKNMRKTTRYLIKQAIKNNEIEVIKSQNINDLKDFDKIYKDTATRHRFTPFSIDYLKDQFSCFSPDDQIVIYLGKYKGKVISSAVMVYWQGIGFYHHGASLSKYNNNKVPVSYLMQWEAIREAKARGCNKYNFWGIAPDNKKKHPWAGLSLFKMGFGGYTKEYVRTQDLVLSPSYYLTYIIEKIRKLKRRL
ncbi:peptidoglycan bridge formation glycyltransferase FemA/FemB family protein [Patescibacteria group bacterium]|nr:peptidoglycan bridge formation glycyltransferase FemA/FemB family protein [Patescibacteria group bacterium]